MGTDAPRASELGWTCGACGEINRRVRHLLLGLQRPAGGRHSLDPEPQPRGCSAECCRGAGATGWARGAHTGTRWPDAPPAMGVRGVHMASGHGGASRGPVPRWISAGEDPRQVGCCPRRVQRTRSTRLGIRRRSLTRRGYPLLHVQAKEVSSAGRRHGWGARCPDHLVRRRDVARFLRNPEACDAMPDALVGHLTVRRLLPGQWSPASPDEIASMSDINIAGELRGHWRFTPFFAKMSAHLFPERLGTPIWWEVSHRLTDCLSCGRRGVPRHSCSKIGICDPYIVRGVLSGATICDPRKRRRTRARWLFESDECNPHWALSHPATDPREQVRTTRLMRRLSAFPRCTCRVAPAGTWK